MSSSAFSSIPPKYVDHAAHHLLNPDATRRKRSEPLRVQVEILPPKEKKKEVDKVNQVAAYILIGLGALFLIASVISFGAGAFGFGAGLLAERAFSLGGVSLLAGLHLRSGSKNPVTVEASLGIFKVSAKE